VREDNHVKIAYVAVNSISVLIMSLNNSRNASDKCDIFRTPGQQFLLLSGQIENDNDIDDDDFVQACIKIIGNFKFCAPVPKGVILDEPGIPKSSFSHDVALILFAFLAGVLCTVVSFLFFWRSRQQQDAAPVSLQAVSMEHPANVEEISDGVGILRTGILPELEAPVQGEVLEMVDAAGDKRKKEDQDDGTARGRQRHSGSSANGEAAARIRGSTQGLARGGGRGERRRTRRRRAATKEAMVTRC